MHSHTACASRHQFERTRPDGAVVGTAMATSLLCHNAGFLQEARIPYLCGLSVAVLR
jgi:hypothetical protein